ncbi:Non-histone chromosomal protein 6 [Coemansia sp. RSA 2681]|nr:Non-histone chromosomal protein 6 [Coemansia sp. RSA 2681]
MRMSNAMSGSKRPPPQARDPNKPKRPMTGYLLFMQDKFQELKKEHPNATSSELFKMSGPAWSSLDEDERRPFVQEAEILQSRYRAEKAKYESKQGADADHAPAIPSKDEAPPKKSKKTPAAATSATAPPPASEKAPVDKAKEKTRKVAAAEGGDAGAQPKKKKKSKDAKATSD